ncbi:MAG: hypothetical protein AAB875_03230 [Patescibacteria group bacterium]
MKVTITKIHRATADKTGKPYVTQDGRPYTRLGIQTREHGASWLSGFGNNYNERWQEGMQVEIEVTTVEKEGKHYLNFRGLGKLELLEKRVIALEDAFRGLKSAPGRAGEVKDEDIPTFDPQGEEEADISGNLPF